MPAPKTIAEIQRLAPGDLPREMDLHRLADAARDLLLPRGRDEECDVVLVRDEAGFEQHRRGIGRSEEHTSELQSLMRISYAVFCLKNKNKKQHRENTQTTTTT